MTTVPTPGTAFAATRATRAIMNSPRSRLRCRPGRPAPPLSAGDGSGRARILHGERHHGRVAHAADRRRQADVALSRLQLYYDERKIEGSVYSDSGAEIRDGIKSAAKVGVGPEALWPYKISKFKVRPPQKVYDAAIAFNALKYERVAVNTDHIKAALASGVPVVIGISLYDSFESDAVAKTGVLPMPDLHKEKMIGGHCMYAVGYGQHKGTFTVRNSWADDWGDRGDCYIPEAYLGSLKFGSDYWLIRGVG
jgi:C1A family cysteine protease